MNKGFVKEKFEFLEDLLKSASTKTVSSELKRLEESPVPYNRMSEFEQTFLQAHVIRYESVANAYLWLTFCRRNAHATLVCADRGFLNNERTSGKVLILLMPTKGQATELRGMR